MRRIALAAAAALAACAPHDAPPPVRPPLDTRPLPPEPPSTAPPEPTTAPTTAPPPQVAPPPAPRSAAAPAGVGATTTTAAPVTTPPDTAPASDGAQTARVSWYGSESGSRTADGTAFDGSQMVFAHRSMAFGTLVRFCHAGACVVARCADRGPAAWTGKTFDLSRAAFGAIAPLSRGVVMVTWEAA